MDKTYNGVTDFFNESHTYPVVKLILEIREFMDMALSIRADVEAGIAIIKFRPQGAFHFIDKLWRVFVYKGLSFDKCFINMIGQNQNKTSKLKAVVVTIHVKDEVKDNNLDFYVAK